MAMARRFLTADKLSRHKGSPIATALIHLILNPTHSPSSPPNSPPPSLSPKPPKKHRKKQKKKDSPRTTPVQHASTCVPHFEAIVERNSAFRFLTKTKAYLTKQPKHVLLFEDASNLHLELGFPHGRKVLCCLQSYPLLFHTYRHNDGKMWFGFSDFMESLLEEEREIANSMEGFTYLTSLEITLSSLEILTYYRNLS